MFDVNSKVVCVDGKFPAETRNYLRNFPIEGEIYTVRDIIPAQGWKGEDTCAILLKEVCNPPAPHRKQWGECGFASYRFRELTEEEQKASEAATSEREKEGACSLS